MDRRRTLGAGGRTAPPDELSWPLLDSGPNPQFGPGSGSPATEVAAFVPAPGQQEEEHRSPLREQMLLLQWVARRVVCAVGQERRVRLLVGSRIEREVSVQPSP